MKWIFKIFAGGVRALSPVPLLAAFMILAAGSAQAQNSSYISDSPPISGTGASELHVIVASMPPKIGINALGSVVCKATAEVQVFDTKNSGVPVASLPSTPVPAGGRLMLTHVLEPSGGDQRQDVAVRVSLTPEPNVGTSLAAYTSICSFPASAQVIDSASGAPQLIINLSVGWDP